MKIDENQWNEWGDRRANDLKTQFKSMMRNEEEE